MKSSQTSRVNFFLGNTIVFIRDRRKLKKFIEYIFKRERKGLEIINFIFCSDKELLKINREYLGHNYLTDIITFDYSAPNNPVISDVYMSIDRIRENTVYYETTLKYELHRVMFHGALHLCGYQDKSSKEKIEMREREEFYLEKYFK